MTDDLSFRKDRLRKEILKQRDSLGLSEKKDKSERIILKLLNLPELKRAQHVFTYVSFGSEVMTHDLIGLLLSLNKTVSVPFIIPAEKRMVPALIKCFPQDLVLNRYGILEPKPDRREFCDPAHIDLVIVPAVVFSESGFRIGYGGGYYDRFLRNHAAVSFGLSFTLQVLHRVPYDPEFDVPVDLILTESRLISCV